MISVFIVEDSEDTQLMLQYHIKNTEALALCGYAVTGKAALEQIPQANPDVVIVDLGLPDINGIECIALLKPRFPNMQFMVYTISEEGEGVFESIKAGATSYITKSSTPAELIQAIKEVHAGASPISSDIARKIVNYFQAAPESKRLSVKAECGISNREEEMLGYLSQGLTYKEVAEKMFISINTLKSHAHNTYEKLQVKNRVAAINKFFSS